MALDFDLKGRTALVTGASQGIGRAICRMLALEGVQVMGIARRVDQVEALSREVAVAGGTRIVAVQADLLKPDAAARLAEQARSEFGRIDILMNVAGVSQQLPFDATIAQWDEGMQLNFFRLRELAHELIPAMRENRWGRVINFTGTSEPRVMNAAFTAKAAVHVWSKGLAREVAIDGVTVNCLQPGRIHSEQMTRRYPTLKDEQEFAKTEIPLGRFGEPEEIGAVALFIASPLASYITGAVIPVDGGSKRYAF